MKLTSEEKLAVIKSYVEAVAEETEKVMKEYDEEDGMDFDDLYSYGANEGMLNVASQILNILNQK